MGNFLNWAVLSLGLASVAAFAQESDREMAAQAFADFEELCQADGGALWGQSLCGRLMVVDPQSREGFFNAPPPVPYEKLADNMFVAQYPADMVIANTALNWDGQRWVQIMFVPEAATERRALIAHEAFHGIQSALGFVGRDEINDHLEQEQARLWMRLEVQALVRALSEEEVEWRTALVDAMRFNRERAILYPASRSKEAALVNHEGIAEYTGVKLGGGEEAAAMAIERLESVNTRPSLVRSIGYAVGPAYGLLLDRLGVDWKARAIAGAPLPLLIEEALQSGPSAQNAATRYGYATIAAEEREKEVSRQAQLSSLRTLFVDGPVLILPFRRMNVSFNPNHIIALDDLGTVRSDAEVVDLWGKLTATGDVLFDSNWSSARVPFPTGPIDGTIAGPGWMLELADGWQIVPGERDGDWVLQEKER